MIIKPTNHPGEFTVHRKEHEPHFALLLSPARRGSRQWGIAYREGPDSPPDPRCTCTHHKNRESAEWYLRKTIQIGNDFQLGLVAC